MEIDQLNLCQTEGHAVSNGDRARAQIFSIRCLASARENPRRAHPPPASRFHEGFTPFAA